MLLRFPTPLWLLAAVAATPKLRVGMIPFTYPPWTEVNDAGEYVGGFLVDFYQEMGFVGGFDIEFVPITEPGYVFTGFTDATIKFLDEDKIDMGLDTNEYKVPGFIKTTPMIVFPHTIMTRREEGGTSAWAVFEPFSNEVWWMIGASVGFGAVVMFSLHAIDSGLPKLESARAFPSFVYHTTAAILGGDEYDLYHCLGAGRLYRLGLLFYLLVIGATYTANLAAFLLRANVVVHGPKTLAELKSATVCNRWESFAGSYTSYVGSFVFPADAPATEQAGLEWARDALQNGECDAIMEIKSSAKLFALEHCDTMQLHPDVEFAEIVDFNLMRASDLDLWQNVSEAILLTLKRPAYAAMVQDHFRFDQSCAAKTSSTSRISVRQLSGVFFVFGACGVLAVAATAARRMYLGPIGSDEKPKEEVQNEKLDAKLDRVLQDLRVLKAAAAASEQGSIRPVLADGRTDEDAGSGGDVATVPFKF